MLATMYVKKNILDKTKDVPVTVLGGMRRSYCVALAPQAETSPNSGKRH